MMNTSTLSRASNNEVLKERSWSIAFRVLFHENGHRVCEQIARSYRALLAQGYPSLADSLSPVPVSEEQTSELLKTAVENGQKVKRWRELETADLIPFSPMDREGEAGPQCVMLLGAHSILDDSARQRLVAALMKNASAYSQFLLIFITDPGELPFQADEELFGAWVAEFARIAPKPVALCIASTEFENGQPIAADDLADGLAIGLFADLVVSHQRAPRIVSDVDDGSCVTLYTIGIRGAFYDPDAAAISASPRLASELTKESLLKSPEDDDQQQDDVTITSPRELLAALDLGPEGITTKVLNVRHQPDLDPILHGKHYSISFEFGSALSDQFIDERSPGEWVPYLRIQRQALRDVSIPNVEEQVRTALSDLRSREMRQIIARLAQTICRAGLFAAQRLCDDISRKISGLYWTSEPCVTDSAAAVEDRLSELDRAVERIPSVGKVIRSALIRLAPFVATVWLAWDMGWPFPFEITGACAIGALVAVAHLWWQSFRARKAARMAAVRTLREIQYELRATLISDLHRFISEEEKLYQRQFADCSEKITRMSRRLAQFSGQAESDTTTVARSRTIQKVPWNSDQVKVLEASLRAPAALARLRADTQRVVAELVPRILQDGAPLDVLVNGIATMALEFCRSRCCRLKLADFLRRVDRPNSPHVWTSDHERHLNDGATAFLQNVVVGEKIRNLQGLKAVLLVPDGIELTNRNGSAPALSASDNVMAKVVRVELYSIRSGASLIPKSDDRTS